MVKPLSFKGDRKSSSNSGKKRKRDDESSSQAVDTASNSTFPPNNTQDNGDQSEEDSTWVTADTADDISGPILLVLPVSNLTGEDTHGSSPQKAPDALTTDTTGKIFPLEIENIVDPRHPHTSEPHDVRQVWIANRVAGASGFSFKSFSGRYLGCDQYGVLRAEREAVGTNEEFVVQPWNESKEDNAQVKDRVRRESEEPIFTLKSMSSEKYVSLSEKTGKTSQQTIRGDSETTTEDTKVIIRMQAKFKPKLKVAKEVKAKEKISRKELEVAVGRPLEDHEVRILKRARRDGSYHETLLDLKVKGKHDKFA